MKRLPHLPVTAPLLATSILATLACGGSDGMGPTTRVPVASVMVSPDTARIERGSTLQLTVTVRDRFQNVLTDRRVAWTTTDAQVATVDSTGLVAGLRAGIVTIEATVDDISGDSRVTVLGPVSQVSVSPDSTLVLNGETRQLSLTVRDAAGNDRSDRPVSWESSDPSVADVDDQGLVTAMAVGETVVRATVDAVRDSSVVEVRKPLIFQQLSGGTNHTCGVTTDSLTHCFGSNSDGQIGQSATVSRSFEPLLLDRAPLLESVGAGGAHTCGVDAETAEIVCWGRNDRGQLGDGSTQSRSAPLPISSALNWVAVTAGDAHACGLAATDEIYCWGANDRGQLGDGTTQDRTTPVLVSGGLTWATVAAGREHTCGVTTGDVAYCWGANDRGQLGDGTTTDQSVPVAVSGGLSFGSVGAGGTHSCAITTTGAAYCWGANDRGQIGDGSMDDRTAPTAVSGGQTWVQVAVGGAHTCAVPTGGGAFCWGANDLGQLGDGTRVDRDLPVATSGGVTFQQVTAGDQHSCGFTIEPIAYCWGWADSGQLGVDRSILPPMGTLFTNVPARVLFQPSQ